MKPSSPTAPIAAPAPTRPRPRPPCPVPARSPGARRAPATPAPVTSRRPSGPAAASSSARIPATIPRRRTRPSSSSRSSKAISSRVNAGEVYLIDADHASTSRRPRTSSPSSRTASTRRPRALLVIEAPDQNLYLASRNHPHLDTITGDLVNAEQLLRYDKIFITDGALGKISARLQK